MFLYNICCITIQTYLHNQNFYNLEFLEFLRNHLGYPPGFKHLENLTSLDIRSYLASQQSKGLKRSSTARAMSTLRNFFGFIESFGKCKVSVLSTVKTPPIPKSVPKALDVDDAKNSIKMFETISSVKWIGKRDKALFATLYGGGLRLGEALALNQGALPKFQEKENILTITGKGQKQFYLSPNKTYN